MSPGEPRSEEALSDPTNGSRLAIPASTDVKETLAQLSYCLALAHHLAVTALSRLNSLS
jgi:hypothetical protein